LDVVDSVLPGDAAGRLRIRASEHPAAQTARAGRRPPRAPGGGVDPASDHTGRRVETHRCRAPHGSDPAPAHREHRVALSGSLFDGSAAPSLVRAIASGSLPVPALCALQPGLPACPGELSLRRRAATGPGYPDGGVVGDLWFVRRALWCIGALGAARSGARRSGRRRVPRPRRAASIREDSGAVARPGCVRRRAVPRRHQPDHHGCGGHSLSVGASPQLLSPDLRHRLRARLLVRPRVVRRGAGPGPRRCRMVHVPGTCRAHPPAADGVRGRGVHRVHGMPRRAEPPQAPPSIPHRVLPDRGAGWGAGRRLRGVVGSHAIQRPY